MHNRLAELLEWANKSYDIVILDTPPILAVADAAIIGNYVGTTLLVARFEENTPKEIDISVKRFQNSGVNIKGCILNGVVKKQVINTGMDIIITIIHIQIKNRLLKKGTKNPLF